MLLVLVSDAHVGTDVGAGDTDICVTFLWLSPLNITSVADASVIVGVDAGVIVRVVDGADVKVPIFL